MSYFCIVTEIRHVVRTASVDVLYPHFLVEQLPSIGVHNELECSDLRQYYLFALNTRFSRFQSWVWGISSGVKTYFEVWLRLVPSGMNILPRCHHHHEHFFLVD